MNIAQAIAPQNIEPITREFLSFRLGSQEYGIDILKVQEIRVCERITPIANTPETIKGVIDLRGIIVPIVDLRVQFGLNTAHADGAAMVIVLNTADRVVGVVVDGVSEVVALSPEQIKAPPEFNEAVETDYVLGLGNLNDRLLILVDIEHLISSESIGLLNTTPSLKGNLS